MDSTLNASQLGYYKSFQCELLRNLVHNRDLLEAALHTLRIDDFELGTCQVIWEALSEYYTQYRLLPTIDMLSMQVMKVNKNADGKYRSYVSPEELEALSWLMHRMSDSDGLNPDFFRNELPSYLKWIRTNKVIDEHAQLLKDGSDPSSMINRLHSIDQDLESAFDEGELFSFMSTKPELPMEGNDVFRVTTGIPKLDALRDGGLMPGELAQATACPGVGKTNMLIHMSVAAGFSGIRSLFISLELPGKTIKRRHTAMAAGIPADFMKIPVDYWPEEEHMKLAILMNPAYAAYDMTAFTDHSHSPMTTTAIESRIKKWKEHCRKTYGTDENCLLVCVDWQDYVKLPDHLLRGMDSWRIPKETNTQLGFIAKRQNVVLWTANQGKAQADGKALLNMKDTAFGYHTNDALDLALGVGISPEYAITEDNIDELQKMKDMKLILNTGKNREGSRGAIEVYRAPTLRLFDNQAAYNSYRRATRDMNFDLAKAYNINQPKQIAKQIFGSEEVANVG